MKLREEADYLSTASCSEADAARAVGEAEQFMALAVSLTDRFIK